MVSEDHEVADNWRRCRAEFEGLLLFPSTSLLRFPLIRHSLLPSAHRRLTSRVARLWVVGSSALPRWPLCRVQCVFCVFYILSQLCVARCDCLLVCRGVICHPLSMGCYQITLLANIILKLAWRQCLAQASLVLPFDCVATKS